MEAIIVERRELNKQRMPLRRNKIPPVDRTIYKINGMRTLGYKYMC
jgi:hypothetical protein